MLKITIPTEELALAEALYASLQEANRLDGWHAMEHDGSYGAIRAALITTLAYGFIGADKDAISQAERQFGRRVADVIYMTAMESGITLAEAIPLVEPMWCYDCARFVKRQDCQHLDSNWCEACQEIHEGYCDARVEEHMRIIGGGEVLSSGRCIHGFSILGRCPMGCDEDRARMQKAMDEACCGEGVEGCPEKEPHDHEELGGINEKETGWTGR